MCMVLPTSGYVQSIYDTIPEALTHVCRGTNNYFVTLFIRKCVIFFATDLSFEFIEKWPFPFRPCQTFSFVDLLPGNKQTPHPQ